MRSTQKFCEITTFDFSFVVKVKSTLEISQNFVAFSEYLNEIFFVILFIKDWNIKIYDANDDLKNFGLHCEVQKKEKGKVRKKWQL